jgi:hypothetical protein
VTLDDALRAGNCAFRHGELGELWLSSRTNPREKAVESQIVTDRNGDPMFTIEPISDEDRALTDWAAAEVIQ